MAFGSTRLSGSPRRILKRWVEAPLPASHEVTTSRAHSVNAPLETIKAVLNHASAAAALCPLRPAATDAGMA
jgi:hypothetical protein